MESEQKLIDVLNDLLQDELTAVNQFTVHSEINSVKGYKELHKSIKKRYKENNRHVEDLIERILILDGKPSASEVGTINISYEVPGQLKNDREVVEVLVGNYNKAIQVAEEVEDEATAEFLECYLEEEVCHLKKIDSYLTQIEEMGLQNFLATKI